jgi:oxygen-independent coproporphyrinogen-3 oxidase
MTALCFVGHSFKYELEAVTRLFIKIKHFDFYYDEVPEAENRIILRRKKCRSSLSFSCIIRLGDRQLRTFKRRAADLEKDEEEYTLCRMLYDSLCSLTGIRPKWGMITGIRPVRMANKLLGAGYDRAGLYEHFRKRYDVSPEKLDLMYETARTQKALLEVDTKKSCAVYVSIPFCPQRCSYCSFVSQSIASAKHLIPEYLELLAREIRLTADFLKSYELQVDSIYFGGGTPTSLEAEQLSFLMSAIEENFDLSSLREYCIEAGRADTITYEKCLAIKQGGADRISVNPQTFTDEVLFGVGRNIPAAMTLKAYEEARRAGIDTINMDFIRIQFSKYRLTTI